MLTAIRNYFRGKPQWPTPLMLKYPLWRGTAPAGFEVNFLGQLFDIRFHSRMGYNR